MYRAKRGRVGVVLCDTPAAGTWAVRGVVSAGPFAPPQARMCIPYSRMNASCLSAWARVPSS